MRIFDSSCQTRSKSPHNSAHSSGPFLMLLEPFQTLLTESQFCEDADHTELMCGVCGKNNLKRGFVDLQSQQENGTYINRLSETSEAVVRYEERPNVPR